jgi:hypothetical protein
VANCVSQPAPARCRSAADGAGQTTLATFRAPAPAMSNRPASTRGLGRAVAAAKGIRSRHRARSSPAGSYAAQRSSRIAAEGPSSGSADPSRRRDTRSRTVRYSGVRSPWTSRIPRAPSGTREAIVLGTPLGVENYGVDPTFVSVCPVKPCDSVRPNGPDLLHQSPRSATRAEGDSRGPVQLRAGSEPGFRIGGHTGPVSATGARCPAHRAASAPRGTEAVGLRMSPRQSRAFQTHRPPGRMPGTGAQGTGAILGR